MAAEEGVPGHTAYHVYTSSPSTSEKTAAVQLNLIDNSSSQISSELTPLFDKEDNLKQPDVAVYNEASSSEESDYNQSSVIFSLDELQHSLPGLRSSVSPEVPQVEHNKVVSSAGLLFPGLIQDEDESFSVSSKEDDETTQDNDQLNLSSSSPPAVEDCLMKEMYDSPKSDANVVLDNKVIPQKDNSTNDDMISDDSLLCHVDSSITVTTCNNTVPSFVPVTVHPTSSTIHTHIGDSGLFNVPLDDHILSNSSPIDTSQTDTPQQIDTPHIETPSGVATITQSSPTDTLTAVSNRGLGETELISSSISSSNPDHDIPVHHEKPIDSIIKLGSPATSSGNKSLSEKSKPTQNAFESPGLLYAHPVKKSSKHVVETLEPAETATEALMAEEKLPVVASQKGSRHVRAKTDKKGEIFIDQAHLSSLNYHNATGIPLFYPPDRASSRAVTDDLLLDDSQALKDIESNAKKIAENLDYMLDNLRYSLHAMATCTKLSVSLHKEAIDDMHVTVDDCIKMMYAFLAKFEELNSNMKPIEALAAQIKDVSESLKILEKALR